MNTAIHSALLLSVLLIDPGLVRAQESGNPGDEYPGEEVSESEPLPPLPEAVDPLPFAKGEFELGFGLGAAGGSGIFFLSVGANFAYYIVQRLAPGIMLKYQAIFGDLEYPQSLTTLPYLKFVLIRSRRFAPYLIGVGGRDFQWAGTTDPLLGYAPIDAWIAGGGVGTHIGVGPHFALNFHVLFLYYFFEREVLIPGEEDPVNGTLDIPISIGISLFF